MSKPLGLKIDVSLHFTKNLAEFSNGDRQLNEKLFPLKGGKKISNLGLLQTCWFCLIIIGLYCLQQGKCLQNYPNWELAIIC